MDISVRGYAESMCVCVWELSLYLAVLVSLSVSVYVPGTVSVSDCMSVSCGWMTHISPTK